MTHLLSTLHRRSEGQATAEYALVMVAAATVAVALIVWASNSSALSGLFDAVVNRVRDAIG